MEYTDDLQQANDQFANLIYNEALLFKVALGIIFCAALFFLIVAIYKRLRNVWESTYFIILCASVLVWTVFSILNVFAAAPELAFTPDAARLIGVIPVPALLLLHIRRQVSYKEQSAVTVIILFVIPVFLVFLVLRDLFFPRLIGILPSVGESDLYILIFYLYAVATLIRSYLLCFSVFYQMPRRTRQSTRYMLVGVSAVALLVVIDALWTGVFEAMVPQSNALNALLPLGAPVAFCFLLYPLYNALYIMPATDVIVTSREFVMGGLSTAILILNRRKEILDWNRSDWGDSYPLPRPLFREPIAVYRKRILEKSACRTSPHDDNLIIAKHEDGERHYLMDTHEASNSKRVFGYVLEISDVTRLYTIMRYFEDIAYFDTLTGLHNRNAYFDLLDKLIKKESMPLLIFVGDVNYLKHINDTYGHLHGDQLLKTIADIIMAVIPEGAFAARTGGDEFVLLAPGGSEEMALKFMRDIISHCEAIHNEVFGAPNISWGYAIMDSVEQSYNEVFAQADAMMYEYKKARHAFRSSGLMPEKSETEPK